MSDDKSKEEKPDDAEVYLDDVHFAELERSLVTLANNWENAGTLSAEEMTEHLESVINIFDGVDDFNGFIEKTGLKIKNDS